ncbi:MAG TPA: hypothetical protein PK303_08870 [bacterium]|nr:hypothetical protein [bacterium]HPP09210.1 hypothetical protein [bacterium]
MKEARKIKMALKKVMGSKIGRLDLKMECTARLNRFFQEKTPSPLSCPAKGEEKRHREESKRIALNVADRIAKLMRRMYG